MPWVRFTADFDFKPVPAVTTAYRAGQVKLVTSGCAKAAIARGKAARTSRPSPGPSDHPLPSAGEGRGETTDA